MNFKNALKNQISLHLSRKISDPRCSHGVQGVPEHLCVQWHKAGTPHLSWWGFSHSGSSRAEKHLSISNLHRAVFLPDTHTPRASTGREQHSCFTPNKSPSPKHHNHSLCSSKGTKCGPDPSLAWDEHTQVIPYHLHP